MSIGGIDKTILKNETGLLNGKGGAAVRLSTTDQPLANLGRHETLYINAHGNTATLGGLRPLELVRELMRNGLPHDYEGKIYLQGCNSATDAEGGSYAERFQRKLAQFGMRLRVKGNSGYSNVDRRTGKTSVVENNEEGNSGWLQLQEEKEQLEALAEEYYRLRDEMELLELDELEVPRELGKFEEAFNCLKSALSSLNCFSCCCAPGEEPLLRAEREMERAKRVYMEHKDYVQLLINQVYKRDKHLRPTLPLLDVNTVHPKGRQLADMYRARRK